MRRTLRTLAAVAMVAMVGAGCADGSAENGNTATGNSNSGAIESAADPGNGNSSGNENATVRDKALRFAACMRDNGVSEFPDPDASGGLTIDGVLNGSSLDPDTPAWREAISACRDMQPPGFTGRKRSAEQQEAALRFAQCMRDNGIEDFPDPTEDGPLIDTTRIPSAAGRGALDIPGFQETVETCRDLLRDALGRQ